MHSIIDFLKNLHDSGHLQVLVHTGGIPLIALIVFAETGLLVGFFLPGDTMLFVAGVGAATAGNAAGDTYLDIRVLILTLIAAGILGDQLSYYFGLKTGQTIFSRQGRFARKVERAHAFSKKYGGWAVLFAKFVPVMRTFVPFLAGVTTMSYRRYALVDSLSVAAWISLVVGAGYFLGARAQAHLHYIVLGIGIISVLPIVFGVIGEFIASRKKTA